MLKLLRIFIVFSFWNSYALAQVPDKAALYFKGALQSEAKKQTSLAKIKMARAIEIYPAYSEAYSLLGQWYFKDHDFAAAVALFRNAYTLCPNGKSLFAFPLAKSLVHAGQPAEALPLINTATAEGKKLYTQALFVQKAMALPLKDTVTNLKRINSSYPDFFPWINLDGSKIYFTRRIRNTDEDFFVSVADECGGWYNPHNMGKPNTANQENALTYSADGHYMFFTQCDNRSENGWGQGGCDILMAYASDSVWSVPESFGATINTPGFEGMACLSPDNRVLYFVSDRPGGFGGLDIWQSRFEEGRWQRPINLGKEVNTSGNETAPFIHFDNQTLYFSSNGHEGMGGYDLFISHRRNDTCFGRVKNMGYPINTPADESSLFISQDASKFFFASDRDSVAGNFDMYQTALPTELQPIPVFTIKGYVCDSLSRNRLNYAAIYITPQASNEEQYRFVSNRGDGSFTIILPRAKNYDWRIHCVNYQDAEFTTIANDTDAVVQQRNIALLPQDYIIPVADSTLLTIYFPPNNILLSEAYKKALQDILVSLSEQDKKAQFYINSYTDNTGSPMLNEQISQQRAANVAKEWITMGVDELNIHIQGFGEAQPIADNTTEEGRNKNRRVELVMRK